MYGINPISPNEERAKTLILFFRLCMAMLALSTVVEFITAASFDGSIDLIDTTTLVLGVAFVAIFRAISFTLVVVFFIMWMRRAYNNLHKTGIKTLGHSEGWAAGSWFVPLMNLGRPLLIMREIWNETQNVYRRLGESATKEEDNVTGYWWTLWLTSNFIRQIGSYLLRDREFEAGYTCGAIGSVGYILCAFFAINMIKKISSMESDMMDRANQYYAWVIQQQAEEFQRQQNINTENTQLDQNVVYPENLQHPDLAQQNNFQDNLLSVIQEVAQLDNGIMNRSKEYYEWVKQQQAEQDQSQQNIQPGNINQDTNPFQPQNPPQPGSEENNSQENFYKP